MENTFNNETKISMTSITKTKSGLDLITTYVSVLYLELFTYFCLCSLLYYAILE